ncbi:hypothetical protein X766_15815 [Mesorhizobium sp. LSJC255A00]|uniref:hypothetical protein n=1 Tax=Mesorhizobium sp. LSJC255A00 TaxID=1287313 RepID=UPI0003CDF5A5|nr:hypothetical protein [Mesorhizobium sp. LSJC255A00]ESX17867.1 hypothetical protein X766_15815 [Mesorhizobium sp. LSJC255A00]
MKKVSQSSVRFRAEDGDELVVAYTNRGEPYREGIQMSLEVSGGDYGGHLFLEDYEAKQLRDLLNRIYPVSP